MVIGKFATRSRDLCVCPCTCVCVQRNAKSGKTLHQLEREKTEPYLSVCFCLPAFSALFAHGLNEKTAPPRIWPSFLPARTNCSRSSLEKKRGAQHFRPAKQVFIHPSRTRSFLDDDVAVLRFFSAIQQGASSSAQHPPVRGRESWRAKSDTDLRRDEIKGVKKEGRRKFLLVCSAAASYNVLSCPLVLSVVEK